MILYSFTTSDMNFKRFWSFQVTFAKFLSQKIYSAFSYERRWSVYKIKSKFRIRKPSLIRHVIRTDYFDNRYTTNELRQIRYLVQNTFRALLIFYIFFSRCSNCFLHKDSSRLGLLFLQRQNYVSLTQVKMKSKTLGPWFWMVIESNRSAKIHTYRHHTANRWCFRKGL